MTWPKAATKTHSDAASSSQLAAAQPTARASRRPVLHEDAEAAGQALDERGEAVGVEEADVGGHGVDDPAGPLLAPGEQVEEPAEGAEQDHADGGGHHAPGSRPTWSRARGRRDLEPVGDEEGHQRAPEDGVEHDGRADALGAEGESGVGAGHAGLGQQPVAEGGPGCRAAGATRG